MIVLRAFHIATRAILVLAAVFWVLIALELLPSLVINGMEGVREKLVYIWTMNRADLFASCQDSLQLLHEGYTDLLIFLMLTWAAVEVNRFLRRRIAAHAPVRPASREEALQR